VINITPNKDLIIIIIQFYQWMDNNEVYNCICLSFVPLGAAMVYSLHPATPRGGYLAVMPTPQGRLLPASLQGGEA
jgi:hypothetical protein